MVALYKDPEGNTVFGTSQIESSPTINLPSISEDVDALKKKIERQQCDITYLERHLAEVGNTVLLQ